MDSSIFVTSSATLKSACTLYKCWRPPHWQFGDNSTEYSIAYSIVGKDKVATTVRCTWQSGMIPWNALEAHTFNSGLLSDRI